LIARERATERVNEIEFAFFGGALLKAFLAFFGFELREIAVQPLNGLGLPGSGLQAGNRRRRE